MKSCLLVVACAAWAASCGGADSPLTDGPVVPEIELLRTRAASVAPFSLTASDGTGLTLESVHARVVLEPPLSFTELELSFRNPEPRRIEGRLELVLPPGASISRLALQMGERFEEGEVAERPRAVVAYEQALHVRRDPALLEHDAGNEYRMRVFPIEANETKRVIVSYSQLASDVDPGYRLHLAGLPKVKRLRVEVSGTPHAAEQPLVFERRAWQPSGDLFVALPRIAPGLALTSGDLALVYVSPAAESTGTAFERVTVLLDTSASSAPELVARVARMRALLGAMGEQRGAPFPVQLVVFDQEIVPLLEARSDQLGPELDAQLRARGALGATDLEAALRALPELSQLGDRVIVYSDGIATAGVTSPPALAACASALAEHGVRRIDAVMNGSRVDLSTLEALVHAELPEAGVIVADGQALDLAAARLLRGTTAHLPVHVEGARWTYPEALEGVEPGRLYPVFARLRKRNGHSLRVDGTEVVTRDLKGELGALLEREWARVRIGYLQQKLRATEAAEDVDVVLAGDVRSELVELSVRERVLSEHTAWVVLESAGDYERNGIARSSSPRLVVQDGALVSTTEVAQVKAERHFEEPWLEEGIIGGPSIATIGHGASGDALGNDPMAALGALLSDQIGAGFGGPGTLGMVGTGRGGGVTALWDGSSLRGRDGIVPARIRSDEPEVRGNLSKEVVRRIVHRHLSELRYCYEQRLLSRPQLDGRVQVVWIVSPAGSVQTAATASSTAGDVTLEQCLVTAIRRWTFPAPEPSGIARVAQRFTFGSPDAGQSSERAERARRAHALLLAEAERARERRWRQRPRATTTQGLSGVLLEVVQQLERGELQAALARARIAQADAPQDVMALLALARAATANGEHDLAARAYGSLIDLFPSRAELRRAAGQALESVGGHGLALALDSYRKAVELRPDEPSGYRLLAFASWRAGDREAARAALARGQAASLPWDRFPGVNDLLAREAPMLDGAPTQPLLRVCLYWETDASDVDLRAYDGSHRRADAQSAKLEGDPALETNVRTGFGPECFTAAGGALAYPYTLEAELMQRGPGGHVLGAAHVLQIDRHGAAHFEMRPFVLMKDRALVTLGEVASPEPAPLAALP